jgi:hypothetical protein
MALLTPAPDSGGWSVNADAAFLYSFDIKGIGCCIPTRGNLHVPNPLSVRSPVCKDSKLRELAPLENIPVPDLAPSVDSIF